MLQAWHQGPVAVLYLLISTFPSVCSCLSLSLSAYAPYSAFFLASLPLLFLLSCVCVSVPLCVCITHASSLISEQAA